MHRSWFGAALGAALLLLALFVGSGPPHLDATPTPLHAAASTSDAGPLTGPGTPSKFGRLTSPRWAWGAEYVRRDLQPVANANPFPEPQPHRDHPYGLAVTPDGTKLYVALAGNEAEPGSEVAVFDVATRQVTGRVQVGSMPTYLGMHPSGAFVVVINRFSNYASVISTATDAVVSEIPLDFYCMEMAWSADGRRAWVSNRYLDQVLVLELDPDTPDYAAKVLPQGGFDEAAFLQGDDNLHTALVQSCGDARCHRRARGGFYAGEDPFKSYFSAIANSVAGDPDESLLLRAVRSVDEGGFADDRAGSNFHAGGEVVWRREDAGYQAVAEWISAARVGPGIPVGNFGSKPSGLALSADGARLYVGNQGTQEISVIDLARGEEVTGIYTQSLTTSVRVWADPDSDRELLIAASMGLGFGAAKERDPYGGETGDPDNPAAQYTVVRDLATTEPKPLEEQTVLGAFDAVDGTAAFKMADIQNDLLLVDLAHLQVPEPAANGQLRYALRANRYEAHDAWVRYTSDSAEILPQDLGGDIPPELQRVVGAFPEDVAIAGDRAFVVMASTSELVEWKIDPDASEASERLVPVAVYETGFRPTRAAVGPAGGPAQGLVFVTNSLGETISVVDTSTGESVEYVVGDLSRPFPDSDAERGEVFVTTSLFAVDGDTSCTSCHIYGRSDGRGWGAGQAIAQMNDGTLVGGGLLAIPHLNNLYAIQPFYFEGTHTAFDAQFDDAREHVALQGFTAPNPHGDFTQLRHPTPEAERELEHEELQDKMSTASWGLAYDDLRERRNALVRQLTMRYFGKAFAFRDFQRFIGEYQAAEMRLVPNPFDQANPSVVRGRMLFGDLGVGCVVCHPPPAFASKDEALYNNEERTLPSLVSFTDREKAFTLVSPHWMDSVNGYERDVEPWERGRIERTEGHVTSFALRGMFDRPFTFLHHGRALSVRESFAAPDHYSLRLFRYSPLKGGEHAREDGRERGFNELSFIEERTYMVDTHGATSHLTALQVQDLEHFLLAIE